MDIDNSRCRIIEEELAAFWPQWHVSKLLSEGDFCEVFEIFRDSLGVRTYSALKVLRTGSTGNDDIPEAFTNEIQIMEALRGAPNIVLIEDFYYRKGPDTSSLYVRMEFLKSFADMMNTNQWTGTSFTIAEVLKVGKDICTALSFCEQKGIIHGDISPENLYVDDFGNYKVGDFGASTQADAAHPAHTTEAGMVSYMAPEVYAGRSYNSTADIYALGLVLYQLLYGGRMPFLPANDQYTGQDIDDANARRLRGEELPPLAGLRVCNDKISAQLDSIIRKACAPDSSMRYQTAKEFYDALSAPEAVADDSDDLSKKRQTAENVSEEPDQKSGQESVPVSAEPAENEKVPVQEEAVTPQTPLALLTGLTARTRLIFACAAIVLAVVLIIIGVSSKSGHKDPIQTASDVLESPEQSVSFVSLGSSYSAFIKTNGSLWMWGLNDYGKVGDGSYSDRHTPVKIMDDVQSVSLSDDRSAAIKTDGSLWMWGKNDYGQLGDGSNNSKPTPVKIMDGVQSVSLRGNLSAAIKTDDSLWMWGLNHHGQLGDGSNDDRLTPVKIMDGVQSVSLRDNHSAAIKTDGSLWMWGYNDHGQLGDGTTKEWPESMKIMENVQSVSLGNNHTAAIKKDGSLWIWGGNKLGQLGDGTTEDRLEPICIIK